MKKNNQQSYRQIRLAGIVLVTCILANAMMGSLKLRDTHPPVIQVWYGERQEFGSLGLPQKWVNVLGNVSDADGAVTRLSYRLNGGEVVSLKQGPDLRRLLKTGDFNAEFDVADLNEGSNQLVLEAADESGLMATAHVELILHKNRRWPLPYSIDWSTILNASDVLQITDGMWTWDANGIRSSVPGYDRVLAIGDMSWTDYEVTVPVTVHGFRDVAYRVSESAGAGFGVNLRWLGFSDKPEACFWPSQPHCGWLPMGASNWYSFKQSGSDVTAIEAEPPTGSTRITDLKLSMGHTYLLKQRVETTPEGHLYRLKIWEMGNQNEPLAWTLERLAIPGDDIQGNLRHGSFLLVAHNVDITFGNIQVMPLVKPTK